MKLNKKGFVSSALLYSLLLLFLALILGLLTLLSNRKQILDKLKNDIKSEINKVNLYEFYENGTEIYYNPVTGKICGDYTLENSKTGVTTGCLKWYIFNDNKNSSVVNMILDHNTSGNIAWVSLDDYIASGGTKEDYGEGNNDRGPITANKRLKKDTENWKQTARLISADEIAEITGAKETLKWNSNKIYGTDDIETKISWLYFDGNGTTYSTTDGWQKQVANSTNKSKYAWLFDNLYNCSSSGCNVEDNDMYSYITKDNENKNHISGYWTSTKLVDYSNSVWDVSAAGAYGVNNVNQNDIIGVRPVITISKKDMNKVQTETVYDYTGSEQTFIVPISGKYKLETWGAQGFTTKIYRGGYGAYSTGTINLDKGSKLYIFVGQSGESYDGSNPVLETMEYHSYPNGGYAYGTKYDYISVGPGGGSTHIAKENKLIENLNNNLNSLLIVASGGGAAAAHIQANGEYGWSGYGGDGGGIIGETAKPGLSNFYTGTGGTQTSGGFGGWTAREKVLDGAFGISTKSHEYIFNNSDIKIGGYTGGGGGFYGGGGSWGSAGGGGSSYIGNPLLIDKAMYCYNCEESKEEATKTISTTNVSETPISNYAKQGNGYAKITYLGNE